MNRLHFAVAALAWTASASYAQDAAPPILRSTTRLVQVNVVAETGKGELVSDLTKDDFTLYDRNKEVPIQFFSKEANDSPQHSPDQALRTLPPNVYSNRLAERAGVAGSMTVILLDGLNTAFADQVYAKDQVLKFLRHELRQGDQVAIYALGSKLRILYEFSSDQDALIRIVKRQQASVDVGNNQEFLPEGFQHELDQFLSSGLSVAQEENQRRRVAATANALESIAHHLSHVPGRKSLVWLTGGFPTYLNIFSSLQAASAKSAPGSPRYSGGAYDQVYGSELQRMAQALNEANVAVYPVDARGLLGPYQINTQLSASSSGSPKDGTFDGASNVAQSRTLMLEVAEATGGKATVDSNDLRGAIRRALDESRLTYVLGYYAADLKGDGKYRPVRVKVRRKGVHLRARKGYFDLFEKAPSDAGIQSLIRESVFSPLDGEQIGLAARLEPLPQGAPNEKSLMVQINTQDLKMEAENGRFKGAITVAWAQLGSGLENLGGATHTVALNWDKDQYAKVMRDGVIFIKTIPLDPKAQQVRVVVADSNTATVGSMRIPVNEAQDKR